MSKICLYIYPSYSLLTSCYDTLGLSSFLAGFPVFPCFSIYFSQKSLVYCVGFSLRACMLSHFSCVWLFVTPWTVACQPPLSMGFSRQEHWSGLPCPPPGDLPNPGVEPVSLTSSALAGGFCPNATWEGLSFVRQYDFLLPWFLVCLTI